MAKIVTLRESADLADAPRLMPQLLSLLSPLRPPPKPLRSRRSKKCGHYESMAYSRTFQAVGWHHCLPGGNSLPKAAFLPESSGIAASACSIRLIMPCAEGRAAASCYAPTGSIATGGAVKLASALVAYFSLTSASKDAVPDEGLLRQLLTPYFHTGLSLRGRAPTRTAPAAVRTPSRSGAGRPLLQADLLP